MALITTFWQNARLKGLTFLAVFFSSMSVFAADVAPMRVLFIGNSYTHNNNMPKIFEQVARSKGVKVDVEMDARSSHTFKMHSKRDEMYASIRSQKWDYVVLQGFSRELSHEKEHIDTASVPYINQILDSIYVNNSCTNVLLYMTWGYENGFEQREEINTYKSMTDSVRVGYEYISDMFGLPIVPVGAIYEQIRNKSPRIKLYQKDEQHPTFNGSYAVACAFYAAIFKAPPLNAYRGKARKKNAKEIQEIAYAYIMDHLDTFKLEKNTLNVAYERTNKGEFFVHCDANYPSAKRITWSFGDGTVSESPTASYAYEKAGTYWVTLNVEDECGVRIVKRKVKFKEPPKPSKNKRSKPLRIQESEKKI